MAKVTVKNRVHALKGREEGDGSILHSKAIAAKTRYAIPMLRQAESVLTLVGDRPLMVNNKLNVAFSIGEIYGGSKSKSVKAVPDTPDEAYIKTFYVMPDSKYAPPHPKGRYGIPTSGIKKCACSAIATTGITDMQVRGAIAKSFFILSDGGGLCLLNFKRLERDIRPVNIGAGIKTCPSIRHRPMFHDWTVKIRVRYNTQILSGDQLLNLFMHAGQYIGLCEMRAEKKQGECGGFIVRGGSID